MPTSEHINLANRLAEEKYPFAIPGVMDDLERKRFIAVHQGAILPFLSLLEDMGAMLERVNNEQTCDAIGHHKDEYHDGRIACPAVGKIDALLSRLKELTNTK